jgi:hypothetical protein
VARRRRRNTPSSYTPPQVSPTVMPDIGAIVRDEVSKALKLPAGATATEMSPAYLNSLQQRRGMSAPYGSAALARSPFNDVPFGPGEPLIPSAINPPMASGRPAPRRWDYPTTWNLTTSTGRLVPWSVLRDAADQVSVVRSCIEVRKSEMTGLEWSFGINSARARNLAERAGESPHTAAAALQDKYTDDIERLHRWWTMPNRVDRWSFSEWLGALLEDSLVLDAVALYPHLNLGGTLHSAELIDGSMIKPLLDDRGATPQPPYAAYQLMAYGFPRGDYQAVPGEVVGREFTSAVYGDTGPAAPATDTLIYKVRNRRSTGPYGFSCVEQALADIDLWLKRFAWLNSEFDAGVTPEMLVNVDAPLTPEQLRQYESVFNDDLSGRSADRHRARFLPAGFNASFPGSFDAKFNSDFDFHLVRLICAAFDVLPTSIGFTPNHGTGSMGSESQQSGERVSQLQRATKPTAQWVTDIINEISTAYLGMPPEITFRFHGLDEDDETREAELRTGYLGSGVKTLNEVRDELNLPRYPFPEANQPYLSTPTGPAWLNVAVQPVGLPGNLPSVAANSAPALEQAVPPRAPTTTEAELADTTAAKAAEAKAFRRWTAKNRTAGRQFELKALTVDDLDTFGIDPDKVKASGDLGKAYGPTGPGR